MSNPSSRLKPEHLDRLNLWCEEELAAFKAKGATDDFMTEPAFASCRNVPGLFRLIVEKAGSA
jgi:hypothetical protein